MSNPRRKHRGNDRTQAFLRKQQEQRDLDFAAIEARYRKEIYTGTDGKESHVLTALPKPREPVPPPRLPAPKSTNPDDLLEMAIVSQREVVAEITEARAGIAEAKQALRERGVSFAREPKSINASVPAGRIGSIPRPKAPTKKPDGSGGKVRLWAGNTEGRLDPYVHRHYGIGDL